MTAPYKILSWHECLGIALMLFGITLGFYSTYLSAREVSIGKADYESFISFRETTVSEMWRCFRGMMVPMRGVEEKIALSRGGLYLFLSGLGIFVVAKRRRMLFCKGFHDGQENHTEQGVAGYPPQGVGSPER